METRTEFDSLVKEIARDPKALRMKRYVQHGNVSTYEHALSVAKLSWQIDRRLRLHADRRALVRAAFLHDYYLYDWHSRGDKLHGYHHPHLAARNAARDFGASSREQAIIRSHMWPLTLFHVPRSREAWIVAAADKICSVRETVAGIGKGGLLYGDRS